MASASEEQAPQKPADGTTVVIMDGTSEKMISIEGMAAITIRANLIEIKVKQQKEDKCTLF
jgi:hypothetical protein